MNAYLTDLFSLSGKTAIVTGASRGIGLAIAQGLCKAGAIVYGMSRSDSSGEQQAEINCLQTDITNAEQFEKNCEQIAGKEGCLDILVNSAGITLPVSDNKHKYEQFSKTLEVNLTAIYQCSDIAAGFMIHGGSIINITSIGSFVGFPGNPSYVASKGGVREMTKALALDLAPRNVRVNNIAPGYTRTNMTRKSYDDPNLNKQRLDRMIIKRWGEPEDMVGAAIFLASNASSYMTGADIVIDGGWLAKGL